MKNYLFPTLSDEELVRLHCTTNSTSHFEALYNRYYSKVYRMCWQLTKDKLLAQDYTQDIFVQVLVKLNHFEGRSAFATWLYTLTRNYCISRLRSRRSRTTTSLDDVEAVSEEFQEYPEQQFQLLRKALAILSLEEANLVVMKYYEGLELAEISEQLTLSVGAVKMRLKRSREKMKKQMISWGEA